MKIVSGKTGSPHVTSQQFRQIMEGIIGDESYIIAGGENLEPELVSNNALKIRSGMLCHHGNVSCVDTGTYDEVELENGSQGMKRIDLVVNRYTRNEETGIESCDWVVLKGTPAESSPTVPEYTVGNLQNGDLVDDCPVFKVELDGIQVTGVMKMLSVLGSNLSDVPGLVSKVSGLSNYTPMLPRKSYSGDFNDMPTGVFVSEISKCTNVPPYSSGMWVVTICYSKVVQITFHIDATIGSRLLAYRNYNSNAWQPWVDINVGFGFSDVWKKGTSNNALLVDLNNPNGENNKTTFVANWNSGTTNLPSDCACGVREVSWVTGPIVMVRITGWTVNTDVPAVWTNVYVNGRWLGWSCQAYGAGQLISTGMSINSNRCSLVEGGYYVQNKMAHIQLKIKVTAALGSRNYWVMLRGLPQPKFTAALAITKYNALGTAVGAYVQKSLGAASGEIVITTAGDPLSANDVYVISGSYVIA